MIHPDIIIIIFTDLKGCNRSVRRSVQDLLRSALMLCVAEVDRIDDSVYEVPGRRIRGGPRHD